MGTKENVNYVSPEVKVVLVEVEQGFAVSNASTVENYTSAGSFSF